jgi:hypothetical protein
MIKIHLNKNFKISIDDQFNIFIILFLLLSYQMIDNMISNHI